MSALPFGPIDETALMVSVDMQRLFLEPGEWFCEAGLAILPNVVRLAKRAPDRCLHTRFITPQTANDAEGRWAHYYQHWQSVTQAEVGAHAMRLHPLLEPLAHDDLVFDKTAHDSFQCAAFGAFIAARRPAALIVFGIESDVCVLATVITALDRGIRVLVPVDAVASSDLASHRATLDLIFPRFDQQIELVTTDQVLDAWVDK